MQLTEVRYQTIALTIPQTQAPNTQIEANVMLDRAFNRITGISVTVVSDGGLGDQLLIAAKTQRQVWVDPVPYNTWNADTGVDPDKKYLSVDIQYASSDVFYIQGTPLAALTGPAVVYMVLRLEADLTETPTK